MTYTHIHIESYEEAAAKEVEIFMSESECDDNLGRGKRLKLTNAKFTESCSYENDS